MGTRRPDDDIDRLIRDIVRSTGEDEVVPPEMVPVIEAGGGVAEGFEMSEEELIRNASDPPPDAMRRVLEDAPGVEAEPDRAVYGEADHERSSEDDED